MDKKVLLIIIDNLKKGGAEILLAGILPELNQQFSVVIVTLTAESDFKKEEIICDHRYSLGFRKVNLLACVQRLRRIIRMHHPSLIHAHLFFSSLIARIACPSKIPLIYTLHSQMSKSAFDNSRILTFLEKATIRKNHSVIAVSDGVIEDYEKIFKPNDKSYVLKNYLSDDFFRTPVKPKDFNELKSLRLVAVGNIKKLKNYGYLIVAFKQLKQYDISLDIYGNGGVAEVKLLQDEISKHKLPIHFKGASDKIFELLPQYDAFVTSTSFEGFGIAAVEAMAMGLPLLLSDLSVLHEVTSGNALFFDQTDPASFVALITQVFNGEYDLNALSFKGIKIAGKYTKGKYLEQLFNIYDKVLHLQTQESR